MEDSQRRAVDALLHQGSPDWSKIDFDLLCPRCDYNLRTLKRPRCPECGLEFDWRIALEKTTVGSGLLFEHAYRKRPLVSWLATVWWSLWPSQVWRRVSLHDPIRVGPLLFMVASGVVASFAILFAACRLFAYAVFEASTLVRPYSSLWNDTVVAYSQFNRFGRAHRLLDPRFWYFPLGVILGIFGLFGLLSILHQTLARYRIRRRQLIRVMAYVVVPVCLWGMVLALALIGLLPFSAFQGPLPFVPGEEIPYFFTGRGPSSPLVGGMSVFQWSVWTAAHVVGTLVIAFYLGAALKRYLRLPGAWSLAFVTTIVAVLFAYSLLAFGRLMLTGRWS